MGHRNVQSTPDLLDCRQPAELNAVAGRATTSSTRSHNESGIRSQNRIRMSPTSRLPGRTHLPQSRNDSSPRPCPVRHAVAAINTCWSTIATSARPSATTNAYRTPSSTPQIAMNVRRAPGPTFSGCAGQRLDRTPSSRFFARLGDQFHRRRKEAPTTK